MSTPQRRYTRRRSPTPVQLPPTVRHGTANAYGHYGCGCDKCHNWRVGYDTDRTATQAWLKLVRKDGAKEYLRARGITLVGPGPFRRDPLQLARLVARWQNDDIETWLNDYVRRNQ